jgi:hypothetical protein
MIQYTRKPACQRAACVFDVSRWATLFKEYTGACAMAIECLEFPPLDSAINEEVRMAVPKPKTDWKGWVALAVTVMIAVVGATWALWHEFSVLDKHISRVEMAVRIIGAKQGGDTKTLMDEALTIALNNSTDGRPDGAKVALGIANRQLQERIQAHVDVPQEEFDDALEHYQILKQSPALREAAHDGILKLAEYRTAIAPPPPNAQAAYLGDAELIGPNRHLINSAIVGNHVIHNSPDGFDIDGFVLKNVVFTDVTIVYRGGPVFLENVRFINCRFEVPDTHQGDQLLEAAIKQQTDLTIG